MIFYLLDLDDDTLLAVMQALPCRLVHYTQIHATVNPGSTVEYLRYGLTWWHAVAA